MEQLQRSGNNIKSEKSFHSFCPFAPTLFDLILCVLPVFKRKRFSLPHWSFDILQEELKLNFMEMKLETF